MRQHELAPNGLFGPKPGLDLLFGSLVVVAAFREYNLNGEAELGDLPADLVFRPVHAFADPPNAVVDDFVV